MFWYFVCIPMNVDLATKLRHQVMVERTGYTFVDDVAKNNTATFDTDREKSMLEILVFALNIGKSYILNAKLLCVMKDYEITSKKGWIETDSKLVI